VAHPNMSSPRWTTGTITASPDEIAPFHWVRLGELRRYRRLAARLENPRGSASGTVRAIWFWGSRWRRALFWAGIAATFVMGLATAITVATIAVHCGVREDLRGAEAKKKRPARWYARREFGCGTGAAVGVGCCSVNPPPSG